ncbi:hypothetical protein [Mycobacterium sp. 050134]|uniref:hypothetical protein n=1 Tax=Mycobacterium sp. 050134 TaxID=3096111 RepID=UPI002ED9CE54
MGTGLEPSVECGDSQVPHHKLRSTPDVEQQWYQAPGGNDWLLDHWLEPDTNNRFRGGPP